MNAPPPASESVQATWLLLAHSAIGRQHVKNGLPCQDAHRLIPVDAEHGVAVVCDGAGSAKDSQLGAWLAANRAAHLFKDHMFAADWRLPSSLDEWRAVSYGLLLKTTEFLRRVAEVAHRDFKALACTVIVVVYSPHGMLICHIGDGRAALRDGRGIWRAAMTPFKGEEANQTIFITSNLWRENPAFLGCHLFDEPITGFTLMSDGCENHAFQINRYDEENGVYIQLNDPYPPFFEPLRTQLFELQQQGYSQVQLDEEWREFIEVGTRGFELECDDKTMIFGILKPCR
ncbi:MAG: PP2C family serine/threonine-protein phosphatase [Methylomagnum sp.]